MTTLYVDMDGVLADFDRHHETVFGIRANKLIDNVDWQAVRAAKDFYLNIPPMPDFDELWAFIGPRKPIVLTGIPYSVTEAETNKRAWIAKHLGPNQPVQCCKSKDKSRFCVPGDILIDDWEKYRDLWLAKRGRWITHTSASETISQLKSWGW